MKRILVPVDFSDTSKKALQFAVNIALKSGSTVFIYHIYVPLENIFIDTERVREKYNTRNRLALPPFFISGV